jgi:hypothetical protein
MHGGTRSQAIASILKEFERFAYAKSEEPLMPARLAQQENEIFSPFEGG